MADEDEPDGMPVCMPSPENIAALGAMLGRVSFTPLLRVCCFGIAACMLGPCVHHVYDMKQLAARVSDLGAPFDAAPSLFAALVCLTESIGTLLILSAQAPRLGAAVLLPKMAVATYGHAFIDDFDDKFTAAYAHAWTPPGCSYNWSVGSSWDCGFFGVRARATAPRLFLLSFRTRHNTAARLCTRTAAEQLSVHRVTLWTLWTHRLVSFYSLTPG